MINNTDNTVADCSIAQKFGVCTGTWVYVGCGSVQFVGLCIMGLLIKAQCH